MQAPKLDTSRLPGGQIYTNDSAQDALTKAVAGSTLRDELAAKQYLATIDALRVQEQIRDAVQGGVPRPPRPPEVGG